MTDEDSLSSDSDMLSKDVMNLFIFESDESDFDSFFKLLLNLIIIQGSPGICLLPDWLLFLVNTGFPFLNAFLQLLTTCLVKEEDSFIDVFFRSCGVCTRSVLLLNCI
ncbi:hypothetical protein TNCT_53311 [Trichonephila clavata]|uniref:Uncharacterized protein n=1 Tax=Trichonephila clavata TaxID=2740835 RepID=A0A8X6JCU0_TRICU|nr:hypothetical protein TNCT_53311 [Trichonephila clavata]